MSDERPEGWQDDLKQRLRAQREARWNPSQASCDQVIPRDTWPGPEWLRGYSARDAFLWYVADAWGKFFGGDEDVETLFCHDFGFHVLRRGKWELRFINRAEFPAPGGEEEEE